jgi:phage shock protein PspC (stress-responsive transcriptional regulator)
MKTEKLYRFPKKGYLGGVCHGIGEHTGVDPILWRLSVLFSGFWLPYLVLWILLKKGE